MFFFTLDRPYLGASLDDIIGDDAIVEVTCPYAGRDLPISPGSKFKFLEFDNGENICLKKSSVNYYEIQGQLSLSNRKFCYFVVFTFKDVFIQKIDMDIYSMSLDVYNKNLIILC